MCQLCDMRDSDDPRDRAVFRAVTSPRFAMMAAIVVNHLMQAYDLEAIEVAAETVNFEALPALMFENKEDLIKVTRVTADEITPLAEYQEQLDHKHTVN